jgi:hypothetical protein
VSPLPEPIEPTTMLSEASIEMRESSPHGLPPKKLALLQLADWDPQKTYDEDPPDCIRYESRKRLIVLISQFRVAGVVAMMRCGSIAQKSEEL